MPELPEVETIRRYLDSFMSGRRIDAVDHLDARMVKRSALPADAVIARLTGLVVERVERAGKFLFVRFNAGEALVLHLGMSGRLVVEPASAVFKPHTHLALRMGDQQVRLIDPRRFGRIAWSGPQGEGATKLGIDPLSGGFTGERLHGVMRGRKVALKSALLNQALIAGLGNIYADEALFLSRIYPGRPAGSLTVSEAQALARAIRRVLRISLDHRGTSFSDYVDALGHPGDNQQYLNVYGRTLQPCPRCHHAIVRVVIGGRSSHFCPVCQPKAD